jgi:tetratricopeptide (TPR) repeat protein
MTQKAYYVGEFEKAFDLLAKSIKINPYSEISSLVKMNGYLANYDKVNSYFDVVLDNYSVNDLPFAASIHYNNSQFMLSNVSGFKQGANQTFLTSNDSLYYHYGVLGSYWLEEKLEELQEYYEENSTMLQGHSPHPSLELTYIFETIGASYLKLKKDSLANIMGSFMVEESAKSTYKHTFYYARTMALGYLFKNQKEQSINWLEKAIELGYLSDISESRFFDSLKNHLRFENLLTKQRKKREAANALVATYSFAEPENITI